MSLVLATCSFCLLLFSTDVRKFCIYSRSCDREQVVNSLHIAMKDQPMIQIAKDALSPSQLISSPHYASQRSKIQHHVITQDPTTKSSISHGPNITTDPSRTNMQSSKDLSHPAKTKVWLRPLMHLFSGLGIIPIVSINYAINVFALVHHSLRAPNRETAPKRIDADLSLAAWHECSTRVGKTDVGELGLCAI
jgi:hypothetical protein